MNSEEFNKFSSVSKILFSDRGDNAINLAVDAFVQMMLQGKSVTELIELLHSKQNCELYKDILKTLKELVKKGVKLTSSEKKKFIMSIRNFSDDDLSEQAYEILSNEEAIDDRSEPAPKRCKIDQDATVNHDVSIKVPVNAYVEDKNDNQSIGQLHIQSGVGGQSNISDNLDIHDDSGNMVRILNKSRNYNEFFKITQLIINFRLNKPKDTPIEKWMENGFDTVIEEIRKDSKSNVDRVILKIFVTEEPTEKAIYIGMRPLDALTSHIILEYMEKVHQSTELFHSSEVLQVRAYLFHPMEGRGRQYNPAGMGIDDIGYFKQKSIIDINIGESCLPISLIVGKCLLLDGSEADAKILNYKRSKGTLKLDARRFVLDHGMKISSDGTYDLELIHKFVKKVSYRYRVVIYNDLHNFKSILLSTKKTSENQNQTINLFYFEDQIKNVKHFFCIKNLKGFFNFKFQCNYCDHLYNKTHICPKKCRFCNNNPPCLNVREMIDCLNCNRRFLGESCLYFHIENGTCNEVKMCKDCDKIYKTCEPHQCFTTLCNICYKQVTRPHYCFIQPLKRKAPNEFSLIFYDFECELVDRGNGYSDHIPNLCVAHEVCHLCAKSAESNFECPNCIPSIKIFENDDSGSCVKKFVDYALKFRPFPSAIIAHNAKSYDGQFILEELCKRDEQISPIFTGCKILYVKIRDIVFLDSLSFIPFALSKFSASFGLRDCEKGEYPYKFNTSANVNYIGRYPPQEMYAIESMSSNRYEKFLAWYESNKDKTFDNRKELIHYCNQDVKILKLGCLNFMYSFLDTTGINPFLQAITLADSVMKVYRKNYLIPNTLSITPKNNYSSSFINLQSKIGLKWLVYQKMTTGKDIRYEVKLKNSHYIVDGFDDTTNTVYSFEGCYYHGHTCFLNRDYVCSGDSSDTIQSRYEATLTRLQRIKDMGYNLVSVWECDFRRFLKSNPELEDSLNNHHEITDAGFDLRSAVYGGRTEVFKLYQKCGPGDKIYYYDFTSLYPWANKYSKYFVGHPSIIKTFENPEEILNYDGVAKCTVLPPRNLYLPCLPYRCNNRLIFPLCRSCTEMINTDCCTHSDDERSLTGFWSLDEIRLAASHGYKIIKAFEVWSYQTVQYNRDTNERGLFADFVDNFLKIKQESSGWPSGTESDKAKEEYIREYLEKEGIQLDKEKICVNKGLRLLTKLVLNSLWGRFIMRENFTKTSICNSPEEINALIGSEDIQLMDLYPVGENQIFVSWKYIADAESASKYVNLGVGICTTTNARIKLYSVLSKLGENLLYCDTDSMIFVVPAGEENPLSCGKFLGELTDELAEYGVGAYIDEYVSCGPKTYALKIFSPSTNSFSYKIVAKGISMNHEIERHLDFNAMRSIVFGDIEILNIKYKNRISRQKKFKIFSASAHKKVQFTLTKRRCVEEFKTLPFGY